jgi:uroporphyrinogen-III synthase
MGMSLSGKTIVITRDIIQAKKFAEKIEQRGATALLFPVIKIIDIDTDDRIREIVEGLSSYDWIIFTSPNAVFYFFKYIASNKKVFKSLHIACVGKKTAEKLTEYNLTPTVIPDSYTSQDLLDELIKFDLKGKNILIPVSNLAARTLEEGLISRGAHAERIEIYQTVLNENSNIEFLLKKIEKNELDCIMFFSPSAVNAFTSQIGPDGITLINLKGIAIAAIGKSTAQAASEKRLMPEIVSAKSDEATFIEELEKHFRLKENIE